MEKHGVGKGLMTIQRLINPGAANLPTSVDNDHGACSQFPPSTSRKPPTRGKKKPQRQQPVKVFLLFLVFFLTVGFFLTKLVTLSCSFFDQSRNYGCS